MIKALALAAVVGLALSASTADAKSCRDAKGKFVACPTPAAAPATKCRDKTTKKFAKCSAPNTEAVAAAKK